MVTAAKLLKLVIEVTHSIPIVKVVAVPVAGVSAAARLCKSGKQTGKQALGARAQLVRRLHLSSFLSTPSNDGCGVV